MRALVLCPLTLAAPVEHWRKHGPSEYAYSKLLSPASAYCYDSIVTNPGCCLDQEMPGGIQTQQLRRPNTAWHCGESCYDDKKGVRGEDTFFVPEGATCSTPRILYVHGGSWEFGSPLTTGYNVLIAKLAAGTGAVVMAPDYPLVPVGNFSVIQEHVRQSLEYFARQGHANCGQTASSAPPLVIGGDSSGGGTALSQLLTHVALNGEVAKLAGAFFFSPWTNLRCDTPDYYYHAFARVVDTSSFEDQKAGRVFVGDLEFQGHPNQNLAWFSANAEDYVGSNVSLMTDPIASPFYAKSDVLCRAPLPPLYFAVGAAESIQGDSVVVAQNAAVCGTRVHLDIYPGMWHDFVMYSEGCGGGKALWPAQRALNNTYAFIKRCHKEAQVLLPNILPLQLRPKAAPQHPHTVINYDLDAAPISEMDVTLKVDENDITGYTFAGFSSWEAFVNIAFFITGAAALSVFQQVRQKRQSAQKALHESLLP